jgi:hypothetical protein
MDTASAVRSTSATRVCGAGSRPALLDFQQRPHGFEFKVS